MEVLTVFKYNSFKIPNRNIEKPLLKNGRISCDGSVTSNIGVDWLNFRTRVFLKKNVSKLSRLLEVLPMWHETYIPIYLFLYID